MSIFWDGSVSACCGDADKKMLIGSVVDNTLEEVWHSEKMNQYRTILADMRYDYQSLSNTGKQGLSS